MMTETKHTPGPWTYRSGYNGTFIIDGNRIVAIAEVVDEDDARVMAASLDMRDALQLLLALAPDVTGMPDADHFLEAMNAARAAIAKATG